MRIFTFSFHIFHHRKPNFHIPDSIFGKKKVHNKDEESKKNSYLIKDIKKLLSDCKLCII